MIEDEYHGLCDMETVDFESKNIAVRKNRGIGVVNQVMAILEEICFGKYHFQVAMILRNSLLISSLLTNAEAWYNLSNAEVTDLEKVDEDLLRKVLECPVSTPREMLYLELGVSPIRNIIRSRRLNFLHYILHEEKQSLIYKFLQAQRDNPVKNDWCHTVIEDIEAFQLGVTIEEIENMSQVAFNVLVKKQEKIASLEYLNQEKIIKNHSKVLHIPHSLLDMQDYLKPNSASIEESKFTFSIRSRMLDIRTNFRGKYMDSDTLCPVCVMDEDTQQHLLVCDMLCDPNSLVTSIPCYDELFGENLEKKLNISRILKQHYKKRKDIIC